MNCGLLGKEEMYCSIYPRRDLDIITVATTKPDWCPLVEIEERKVGKWLIKDNGTGGKYVECPFCGALAPSTEFADRTVWKYSKFCYDCGNELRGSENGR
jgi:hypothetical protein